MNGVIEARADSLSIGQFKSPGSVLTAGSARWAVGFAIVLALHVGLAAYVLSAAREALDGGNPEDVINVELMPDLLQQSRKPDDVAGPQVAEAEKPTSEKTQAEDPNPPAPDSAPPTETKREPDATPQATAPPSPAKAEAVLPPTEKPEDRPRDPKPETGKQPDAKKAEVERQTAPSQASNGSAALLGGGRRPSAAAQASWRGEVGTHLVHLRRYPQEARAQGWQGTARVRVTIDADGHVLDRELVKSTGRDLLDGEALALVKRSDPFPKPPKGMATPIAMTVPVNFSIR